MGIPTLSKIPTNFKMTTVRLKLLLAELLGEIRQPYPPYSGKTIEGVKMFELAKAGTLDQAKIPFQTGQIFEATLLSQEKVPFGYLKEEMSRRVLSVAGDFRQKEIIASWYALPVPSETLLPSYRIRLSCSSGLFVRSIANDLGKQLHVGGLSTHILRTQVGGYSLEDCIHLVENT
jgi:tRNA pseudouridine55 synthase